MDMLDPQNRGAKEFFTWLGKYNWLKVEEAPNNQFRTGPDFPPGMLLQPLGQWFYEMTMRPKLTSSDYYTFYVWSRFLAGGPKRFKPTMEQCLAMEQMEINIPCSMYRQAYEVVAIDFPQIYCDYIVERFKMPCPAGMLSHRLESIGGVVMVSFDRKVEIGDYVKLLPNSEDTIESEIRSRHVMRGLEDMVNEEEWSMSEHLERLAINLNLLLCNFPTKLTVENQKRDKELSKQMTVPNRRARDRAAIEYGLEPKVISFVQQIRLFDDERTVDNSHGGTHNSPTPHWRKGHWRQQRYGVGLQHRKPMFIKPVMVNDERFLGDKKDTATLYEG